MSPEQNGRGFRLPKPIRVSPIEASDFPCPVPSGPGLSAEDRAALDFQEQEVREARRRAWYARPRSMESRNPFASTRKA